MPKDTNLSIQNSFVMVSIEDLQRLQAVNASGLVMRTWMALRSYCWNGKRTCFPSIASIAERMGYTGRSAQQSIGKALKFLEDNGFIRRNDKRSTDRFVMLDGIANQRVDTSPNSERKKTTEVDESTTPLNPPVSGGKPTKKQRVRSQRRRKRLRKRDRLHIAETTELRQQEQEQLQTSVEGYNDAIQGIPAVLDGLESEHLCNETPNTPKDPVRAFFVASILHLHQRIDKLPPMPEKIVTATDLLVNHPGHHQLLWDLRLDIHKLWFHIRMRQS